ncbi:alkaline phosphatase D family protein [Gammaproteobacteria bacterium]|jgi:alkaline phosphatase D|nr:alkaline phosphatase D family protein [Gammaproteobacteria bacterium]
MKRRQAIKITSVGAIGLSASISSSCSKNTYSFNHGVASGDPLEDRVILWTRVTPQQAGPVEVILEVSENKNFSKVAYSKKLNTSSLSDYTIKYDFLAKQYCNSDNGFFYRFRAGNSVSETGRSKTFSKNIKSAKIAIFSCSNFPAGYFNAYQAAAEKNDLDLWLHLGDYLYEYPMGGYATENAEKLGRAPIPIHEMITLSDYRQRHAQYKLDQGSIALHKHAPLIAVWDDHEFSNDAWKRGAENHSEDGSEGDFYARRSAAIKAYYEWMPIREQQNKRRIFRDFKIGKLMHLIMLDTRQFGRDKQIQPKDYLSKSGFNQAKFYNDLNSEYRELLGAEQFSWIEDKILNSNAAWTIFGQQVLMTKLKFPDISKIIKAEEIPDFLKPYLKLLGLGIPSNLDAWDGYPAARNKLYKLMKNAKKKFISLAGDTHNSWVSELENQSGKKVGIELGAPSVTSPGITDVLNLDENNFVDSIVKLNKELQWMNPSNRGYLFLDCTDSKIIASFNFIKELENINSEISSSQSFLIHREGFELEKIQA